VGKWGRQGIRGGIAPGPHGAISLESYRRGEGCGRPRTHTHTIEDC